MDGRAEYLVVAVVGLGAGDVEPADRRVETWALVEIG
jgi:hypothetical protein